MASNSCVSSGKTSRTLIVEIKAALLRSSKKIKNVFVKVEINQEPQNQDQPLRTKMVSSVTGSVFIWNQKFVFYVPHRFHSFENNRANISFQIYMKKKFLPDELLGEAQCKLDDLLSQFEEVKKEGDDNDRKKEIIKKAEYDTEDDDSNMDDSEIDEPKEQQEPNELKSLKILEISKGEVSIGKLSIEVNMRREYLRRVGDFKWQNFAMDYDEFMMEYKPEMENKKKKKQKPSLLMCFRAI